MTAHMVVGILACIVEFSGFIACSVAAGVITAVSTDKMYTFILIKLYK